MKNEFRLLFVVIVILFIFSMFGCAPVKSYVDPQYGRASYDDITRRSEPYKLKITVEFQRNGTHISQLDSELKGHVERVIRGSGFAIPATQDISGELKVMVNNVADLGEATAKGFGTGLTFGLVGSTVTDYYEMEATLSLNGNVIKKTDYKHALHSTVGLKKAPEGLEPMTPSAAFGKVVEQLILNFLQDIQNSRDSAVLPCCLYNKDCFLTMYVSWAIRNFALLNRYDNIIKTPFVPLFQVLSGSVLVEKDAGFFINLPTRKGGV